MTTLLSAIQSHDWPAVRAQIPTADLSATAGATWTPLHFAAASAVCPADIVTSLLESGASLEARAASGSTPLHLAAWHDCRAHVTTLLKHGAAVDAKTKARRTPLHFAARRGHGHVVRLLVANGADVDHVDAKGMSGLHFAADGGHVETVTVLIEGGCKLVEDEEGRSAFDIARNSGSEQLMDVLEAAFGEEEQGDVQMTRRISSVVAMHGSDTFPWLSAKLASLSARAGKLVKSFVPTGKDISLGDALGGMSGEELAATMTAYVSKGMNEKERREAQKVVRKGVEEYCLTGALLLANRPTPQSLVMDLLEMGGGDLDGPLYEVLIKFVRAAREARGGMLVQTSKQKMGGVWMRKEVYMAVGAGVLFSLLIPLTRK